MFKRFFSDSSNTRRQVSLRSRNVNRLGFEPLEDRRLLATFTVINNSDGPVAMAGDLPGSLRQAIFDANANGEADTIVFGELFDVEQTIELESQLPTITEAVAISGPGQDLLTLDAGNGRDNRFDTGDGFRIFEINDGIDSNEISVSISGLTLTGGDTDDDSDPFFIFPTHPGGAILSSEFLVLADSTVSANASGSGGGGGIHNTGTLTVVGSTISGNSTEGGVSSAHGGGIFSDGILTVVSSTISDNMTGLRGNGGGIYNAGLLTISNGSTISDNRTGDGRQSSNEDLTNGADGGGIFSDGVLNVSDSTISGNSTGAGGNAFGVTSYGGYGNYGGEYIEFAGGNGGTGGGIFGSGTLTITNSTISGNVTGDAGMPPSLNSNFPDLGEVGGEGAGIFADNSVTTIVNSTITNNTATGAVGGVAVAASSLSGDEMLTIRNSIIVGNSDDGTEPNLEAPNDASELEIGFSVIGRRSGVNLNIATPDGNGNFMGFVFGSSVNFLLEPLADNGGPTQTHALVAGSFAIDAGNNAFAVDTIGSALLNDQRGEEFARFIDGDDSGTVTVDIGAFEFGESNFQVGDVLVGDVDQNGLVNFFDIAPFIDLLAAGDFLDEADIDRNGVVNFLDISPFINVLSSSGTGPGTDTNFTVSNNELAGPGSLAQAIEDSNLAAGADTIEILPGVGSIVLTDQLVVTDSLTIEGNGNTIFGNTDSSRIFDVRFGATEFNVNDVTLAGGGSFSTDGGAIFAVSANTEVTVTDSILTGNKGRTGGAINSRGTVIINNSEVVGNEALQSGGGIFTTASGGVSLTDSSVSQNVANASGGGIGASEGDVTLVNSLVSDNTAIGFSAGGILVSNGNVILDNSIVSGNSADGTGGGVVSLFGNTTLTNNSSVSGNSATTNGGGIFTFLGDVTLTNGSSVSDNTASNDGGGIDTSGDVTLDSSTVSGNTAEGGGGGISANRSITLINSTVSGNTAGEDGGGVLSSDETVSLTNSTIAGNTAGGVGGGIVFDNGNGNFTPETLLIRNSIIAGNLDNGTAPDFLAPTVTLAVFNSIVGDTTGTTLTAGNNNRLNVDFATVLETEVVDGVTVPLLTDNGGGVETIALLANSPAIDAGSNAFRGDLSGTTDQRGSGFDRFIDGDNDGTETVDIGAFEFDFDFASTFLLASVTQASSSALEPSSANLSDAQPEVFDELELLDFELDEVFDGLSLT